jgi:hypothetical protein
MEPNPNNKSDHIRPILNLRLTWLELKEEILLFYSHFDEVDVQVLDQSSVRKI